MYYWNDEAVENIQPVNDNKRKFTVKVYKSDGTKETYKDTAKIVVDVEKTDGITVLDMLDPDYTELKERIEALERRGIICRLKKLLKGLRLKREQ